MASGTITRATPVDMALLVLVAMTWASAFVAIKIAVPEVGPLWLAAIRVSVGALVLLPIALWSGFVVPKHAGVWALVIAMALLNVVIPFFLISWAELTIDAGATSLLMGTGPIFGLIIGHFFTHDDKINPMKALAVAFGFSGVLLIVGGDALADLGGANLLAQLAALTGSICYVIAGAILRRIDIPPLQLAALALTTGALILLPVATLVDGIPTARPSFEAIAALVFLGVFPTGLAYVLRFHLIRKIGYVTFSLSIYMIPVFGLLLGFLILGEALRPILLAALALIITGLWFAKKGSGAAPSAKPAAPVEVAP